MSKLNLSDKKLKYMTILIGYMRVSKADGTQVLDLQKDALLAAGIHEDRRKHKYFVSFMQLFDTLLECIPPNLIANRY